MEKSRIALYSLLLVSSSLENRKQRRNRKSEYCIFLTSSWLYIGDLTSVIFANLSYLKTKCLLIMVSFFFWNHSWIKIDECVIIIIINECFFWFDILAWEIISHQFSPKKISLIFMNEKKVEKKKMTNHFFSLFCCFAICDPIQCHSQSDLLSFLICFVHSFFSLLCSFFSLSFCIDDSFSMFLSFSFIFVLLPFFRYQPCSWFLLLSSPFWHSTRFPFSFFFSLLDSFRLLIVFEQKKKLPFLARIVVGQKKYVLLKQQEQMKCWNTFATQKYTCTLMKILPSELMWVAS